MKITGYWRDIGTAYRCYKLQITSPGWAEGWLEDDFHHFGVRMGFTDGRVTSIDMFAPRTPWTTCGRAVEALRELIGQPLISRCTEIGTLIEMRHQCTHVFDLVGLLMAHISNRHGRPAQRTYLSAIPDRKAVIGGDFDLKNFGPGHATLYQDGKRVMQWQIDGERITAPASYSGTVLNQGFREWTETLPEQEAEYATVLRRAINIAAARVINSDDYPTAADMSTHALCYTFQPSRSSTARRNVGNARDYSGRPQQLLKNIKDINE